MFIEPETVPAYLPPISMQAAQLGGITISLQKPAMPMASITQLGLCRRVAKARKRPAPRKPKVAIRRRLRVSPMRSPRRVETEPHNSETTPPKNSGNIARRAASPAERFQNCCRNVGTQVTQK